MRHTTLIEISSVNQLRRGTRAFRCTTTGCVYTSHASGNVRRANVIDYESDLLQTPYVLNRNEKIMNEQDRLNKIYYYSGLYVFNN